MSKAQDSQFGAQYSALSDALKRYAPLGIGAAIAGAAGTGLIDINLPPWVIDMLKQWGPAGVLILGFVYYVPRDSLPALVRSQQAQAVAMTSIAESLRALPQKDDLKFQEIIVGQEMLNERLDTITDKIDRMMTADRRPTAD